MFETHFPSMNAMVFLAKVEGWAAAPGRAPSMPPATILFRKEKK